MTDIGIVTTTAAPEIPPQSIEPRPSMPEVTPALTVSCSAVRVSSTVLSWIVTVASTVSCSAVTVSAISPKEIDASPAWTPSCSATTVSSTTLRSMEYAPPVTLSRSSTVTVRAISFKSIAVSPSWTSSCSAVIVRAISFNGIEIGKTASLSAMLRTCHSEVASSVPPQSPTVTSPAVVVAL